LWFSLFYCPKKNYSSSPIESKSIPHENLTKVFWSSPKIPLTSQNDLVEPDVQMVDNLNNAHYFASIGVEVS
jgi:hypothetical protein